MRSILVVTALLALSCRPPAPPPATTPPPDAPPAGAGALTGQPKESPRTGPPPNEAFAKAIKFDFLFDKARSAVVAKIHLEPGFHAYGPGEETGRPLALELTGEAWTAKETKIPPGEVKDLGEMGKSVVVTGDVEALVVVAPGKDPAAPVTGVLRYQVCSEKSCDRPRTAPFSVQPS